MKNGEEIPPDIQLKLHFTSAPALGNTGQVRIYNAADDSLVDTIDVGTPVTGTNFTIGGAANFHLYPVLVDGNTATVFPHEHNLDYHKSYYVQMDSGVLKVNGAPFPGINGKTAWTFSTKTAPPPADATRLVVAADGTGDFATVQGAVDFVPAKPRQRVTIFIRKGLYVEVVNFTGKSDITFLGEDRAATTVGYPNNDRLNAGTAKRSSFAAIRSTGIVLANLSFRNSTPKGGSQAESLMFSGGQNIITHCNFSSLQDTLLINNSAYVADSYIEGDVDFMWGTGPVFFQNCEIKGLTSKGYFSQIRNAGAGHGYVYDHCIFGTAPGVTGMYLSRIAPSTYPNSEFVLLDCALGDGIIPAGWLLNGSPIDRGGGPAAPTTAPGLHFWEFNSTNLSDGKPVDVSQRADYSRQLTMEKDADTIKNYRDPSYVLGWTPKLAPIVTAPVTWQTSVSAGTSTFTFTVNAAGIPAPTYQWMLHGFALMDGEGVSGATTPTLTLSKTSSASIGDYSVVIANAQGSITVGAARTP